MSCCCVPVRFLNTDDQPITDVHWVRKDVLTAAQLDILVRHEEEKLEVEGEKTDLEVQRFDVVKTRSTLFGRYLVEEVTIKPYKAPPEPWLKALWAKTHNWRKSNPILSFVVGLALGLIAIWAFFSWAWPVVLAVLEHPLAAMVWVWSVLADGLDIVVLVPAAYFVFKLVAARRFVASGLLAAAMVCAVSVAGAIEFGVETRLGETPEWPGSYRITGEAMRDDAIAAAKGWGDWLEPIWPMLAVLLNAAGLTLVAGFLDKALPWARGLTLKPKGIPVLRGNQISAGGRSAQKAGSGTAPVRGPHDPILEAKPTPKDAVPEIPQMPDYC